VLRQRIITALAIGAVVLAGIFLLPHSAMMIVLALLVLLGAWEWSAFPGFTSLVARGGYVALIGAGVAATWWFAANGVDHWIVLYAAAAWWVVAVIWVAAAPAAVNGATAALAGFLVLVPTWLALVKLHATSPSLMLYLLLLVVATDVGAYFSGRAFGKNKLAPRVSPGKTWEGVAGGLLGAGVIAVLGVVWFALPATAFIGVSAIAVVASIIGDLTESLFKRHAGVKDSGSLLPGHGGILDRVDSVTAAAPVFVVGLERLGLFR
jgi:phosphatidate cytidylyltransferase